MHQAALDNARVNAVMPLFVPLRPKFHGRNARFVLLGRQAGIPIFDGMARIYSGVMGPLSLTSDLINNFHLHTLAIGFKPCRKFGLQLGFDEGIQFGFIH
jgi:hypothetical protein